MTGPRLQILPVLAAALLAAAVSRMAGAVAAVGAPATAQVGGGRVGAAAPDADELDDAQTSAETPGARLAARLTARQAELEARARELDTREATLAAAERRLEARFAEIRIEAERLAQLEAAAATRTTEEFATLSRTYERVRPRDAARIFELLEPSILLPVAAGMRTQALSAVLGEMDPAKAEALTALLAGRTEDAPADGAAAESDAP
ncbi:MAG: MotE family protein [Parvularculaceae bacterium]